MAAPEFKHLDSLPIDESYLSIQSEPQEALKCKSYINLSINASDTIFRLNTLLKYINEDINNPIISDTPNFKLLNLTL